MKKDERQRLGDGDKPGKRGGGEQHGTPSARLWSARVGLICLCMIAPCCACAAGLISGPLTGPLTNAETKGGNGKKGFSNPNVDTTSEAQAARGTRHAHPAPTHARVLRLHGASRAHATRCHARVARRAQAPPTCALMAGRAL